MEPPQLCGVIYTALTLRTWASMCNHVCPGICVLCEQAGQAQPMGPVGGFMHGERCAVLGERADPETPGPATKPDVLLFIYLYLVR